MIRAGIHVGPVRIIDNDIFGMMVNYTKRIESAALGGGIILSNEAKTHIDYEKDVRHSKLIYTDTDIILKGFNTPQKVWKIHTSFGSALAAIISESLPTAPQPTIAKPPARRIKR
jgi:class 3 adenylate cyclase